ncbi:NB-ARC domain-containing protein [Cohnella massiliensis]|uniref:NB-ARC domain-containing protein n=1 Tax=Cohnella massiliensis TaxID=1816691 RepID=UPI0009BC65B8|nr:NB-ARC domain-containing protein [Cohnella massiliensis]
MERVPSADGRVSRVIGFAKELESLEEWMADPAAGTAIFSVSGIGGIGKTTLLTEMARKSRESSFATLWLDGRGELSSSGTFLTSIEANLENEYGRTRKPETPLLPYVVAELSSRRTVLLMDNCEDIDRLEGWLLSSFLPKLESASVLLVVASRNELSVRWRANPYWGMRLRSFPLRLFTREEVHDYLAGRGFAEELRMDVAQKTDGHPLLLALTVDWLRSRKGEERSAMLEIPGIVSAELLREVASPSLYPALAVLSLLPSADLLLLNRFLEVPLDAPDYRELGKLSFVRMSPQGLVLHHVAARLLREEYAARQPAAFQQLRQKAFRLLAKQYHAVDKRLQMRFAAHILELYREFLPSAHAYANFASRLRAGEIRPFRPEDLPHLQRFLAASAANWQSELIRAQDHQALLGDIAKRSPEGICVVRNDDGLPLAFCAGVWLHASTLPLIERYAPGFIPILGEEFDRLHRVSPEAADSLCVLLAAVDVEHPLYRPEELGALLMQQWLIRMAIGLRGVMVTADPQLKTLLPAFGFKELGPVESETAELTKWELDFRQSSFDDWIQNVIRQTEPAAASRSDYPREAAARAIDAKEMKQILERLFDDALNRLPAVARLNRTGAEVRQTVLQLLEDERPAPPLTHLEQRILKETYVQKDRNKEQLAGAFHMSRTTFYRHSQTAVRHLASVLARAFVPSAD